MPDLELQLENVTPQLSFAIAEGKVWLNEQRIMLFSQAALGKFRREVFDTIGLERAKPFFLRLGFQLGRLDGELARNSHDVPPSINGFSSDHSFMRCVAWSCPSSVT